MNADLENLVILQAQDLELKRLREELAEAPRRVAAAEATLAKSESAFASAKASLLKEESLRKSHELDIKDRQGKITRLRKQMETAANAAQIAALEHEITFSEQAISTAEDAELASLERTDAFDTARATSTSAVETHTAALAAERARSADLTTRHKASIAGIESERSALRSSIASTDEGETLLANYDRIAKGKGTALSEAVNQKCSACQMLVRPQRWNDLTNRDPHGEFANTVFYCETCGRMLFYDPRRDAPVRWSPGDRLAAATK